MDALPRALRALSWRSFYAACVLAAGFSPATSARADTVKVIVPFAPGSIVDIVPRIVFAAVATRSTQSFIVENKPGAGSLIGSADVANAKPDGDTVLATSSALTIAPILHPSSAMNLQRRLTGVTSLGTISDVLVVSPNVPTRTLQQFVAWAKRKHVTFASLGVGSAIYMNAERFAKSAGLSPVNVSFTGAPQALAEVVAGRVDFCFCAIGTALPYIRAGKLTAIAVSSPRRSALLPHVPTTLEEGYKKSDYSPWLGVFVPAQTSKARIEILYQDIKTAMASHELQAKLRHLGFDPRAMAPKTFNAFVRHDAMVNAALATSLGLNH